MSTAELEVVVARSPLPAHLKDQYAGLWVALRDGRVVASDDDREALSQHVDVSSSDALYHVPERGSYYYF